MTLASHDSVANRLAQLSYLAEDKELLELIWKISALSDNGRMIVQLMVAHLAEAEKGRQRAA